jgi:hypothetical protein
MSKISTSLLLVAALCCGHAQASLIDWTVTGTSGPFGRGSGTLPGGSFTFDTGSSAFSNVNMYSIALVNYTSGSGTDHQLNMYALGGIAYLGLTFADSLATATITAFTSSEGTSGFFTGRYHELFTGDGTASTTAVPEPGSLMLLGAGLASLAFLRRRKQAV